MDGRDDGEVEVHGRRSRALELGGDLLAAVVDEEGEVDGDVEVDAEDVGPEGGAEADGCLEVEQAVDERAAVAGLLRELADAEGDEPVEHVFAGRQLEGVDGALPARRRRRRRRRRRLRRRRASAAGAGQGEEEEEVEGQEETRRRRATAAHG